MSELIFLNEGEGNRNKYDFAIIHKKKITCPPLPTLFSNRKVNKKGNKRKINKIKKRSSLTNKVNKQCNPLKLSEEEPELFFLNNMLEYDREV